MKEADAAPTKMSVRIVTHSRMKGANTTNRHPDNVSYTLFGENIKQ
jgi:hypothetical protein